MTAGKGIEHSEMFPLLNTTSHNPLELFQIWINLPASHKLVQPHFTMMWAEHIPRHTFRDAESRSVVVVTIAGELTGTHPVLPF